MQLIYDLRDIVCPVSLTEEQIKLIPDIAVKILMPGMGKNTCILRLIIVSLFQWLMLG